MKHVLLAIAAHCQPEVIKYTLGTWLETYDGSYRATVCVSLGTDFESVCQRADEILGMSPPVDIIRVPKTDPTPGPAGLLDFSCIHANCIRAIFRHCQDIPFTHVAVLDHDLEFRTDFLKWAIEQDKDMVCSLFRDRDSLLGIEKEGFQLQWAPKCSVWHTVLSRRLFDRIMENPDVVMPALEFRNLFYDTMSKVFELATTVWNLDVLVLKEAEIEEMVEHLWSLSFDFGPHNEGHYERLHKLKQDYACRFPEGIGTHLKRIIGHG